MGRFWNCCRVHVHGESKELPIHNEIRPLKGPHTSENDWQRQGTKLSRIIKIIVINSNLFAVHSIQSRKYAGSEENWKVVCEFNGTHGIQGVT